MKDTAWSEFLKLPIVFSLPVVLGFLTVLARMAALFTFFPIPGSKSAVDLARIVFSLSMTVAMSPFWPLVPEAAATPGGLLVLVAREAAIGLAIGLVVQMTGEALTTGAQLAAAQAGYSYATSVDPSSDADSGLLPILAQLMGGLLFFAFGLDRHLIAVLARSLETLPPGLSAINGQAAGEFLIRLLSEVFVTGFKLALPVVAMMLALDVAMALMSKVNQQLQLLSMAFPAKMLMTLVLLALLGPAMGMLYQAQALRVMEALRGLVR
jgi:flagellar biosynthetic protein FliR